MTSAAGKAQQARKAALKGTSGTKSRKIRTSTKFKRPVTLRQARSPLYPRKSVSKLPRMDKYRIVRQPLTTETAMKAIEEQNTLTFLVDLKSNKHHIRSAIKELYDVEAIRVNTMVRPDGRKKALVRLTADVDALDVANKIGII
ncbi:60S ribosomal protein L25 [Tieghemiomyces parasiticus]|uniref:60S ribosomal protein L25 n=1 Tax=Tieghemiomyces parasiticus TaxID=78921 RepID=A0A9W8AAE3_9FUNG|nr:60S ribosomal protein L25 [Tieghemiomyces parasiticus]KAJ1925150.1 60S ribosomal protein L25 [Tieghemiomyces parasiticus]